MRRNMRNNEAVMRISEKIISKKALPAVLVSCFLSIILFSSCGESFPQYRYVLAERGLLLRKGPLVSTEAIEKIPYGFRIKLLERTGRKSSIPGGASGDDTSGYWYYTEYAGKTGWIFGAYLGTVDQYFASVKKESLKLKGLDKHVRAVLGKEGGHVTAWFYPGGEMINSEMFFCGDGVCILSSQIFTKNKEPYIFRYQFRENNTLLRLVFADHRLVFKNYARVESDRKGVKAIDYEDKAVLYRIAPDTSDPKLKSFCFLGWCFFEKPFDY